MSWTKLLFFLIIIISFEILIYCFLPYYWIKSNEYLFFFFIYELLLFGGIFLIYKKYLITPAITIILLLFVNFFTINFDFHEFKTLKPNLILNLEITGDTMPNFYGINTITTDHKGFRTITKINYDDKNSTRIFTIGASTTEEIYTDDNETWSALLNSMVTISKHNKPLEVINTGLSGLRAVNMLNTIKKTENYNPSIYIIMPGVNDWNKQIKDTLGYDTNMIFKFEDTLLWFGLSFIKNNLNKFFKKNDEVLQKNNKNIVIKEYGEYFSKQNNSLEKKNVKSLTLTDVSDDYKKNIINIAERCSKSKYHCFFVTQPTAYKNSITPRLKSLLWMTPPNVKYTLDLDSLKNISELYNSFLKETSEKYNLFLCDIADKMHPTEEFFYDDVHFNEKGSAFVAKEIANCINHSKVI